MTKRHEYRKWYDFESFFLATIADWSLCEIPDRDPDFVSWSGSAYWHLGLEVRRLSDHWGTVASCKWLMEGRRVRAFLCGKCPYDEFRPMSRNPIWTPPLNPKAMEVRNRFESWPGNNFLEQAEGSG